MLRLLFWIALIAAAFWLWRRFKQASLARQSAAKPSLEPTPMVRCAHCAVHLPRQQALQLDDKWYCSQAHLEQGPTRNAR
ncbi:PP0621 family protein [Pseudomonas sp. 5P_3.1_Bac2]|uniref:PP0621 family protein n=1 Tax=Pseudomonas sp. 5P_3.1_Bac2 TaxID=2971617 RepID=UPI0021C5DA21|nr:PP0621 family protein [Pseudomonas sp. 5P_3.1_Bac2]MCU1718147.1 PP0621 family protein [Pseudomonas sp. 5P_3.1_Bac2]